MRMIKPLFVASLFAVLALSVSARAESVVDLTAGGSGWQNGAFFTWIDQQSTGTGVIHPFVQVQHNGSEQGYNSDKRPVQFDEANAANWNHSFVLSDVALVGGYRVFLLDINENKGGNNELLSLNEIEVWMGNSPSLDSYVPDVSGTGTGFGANANLVYDLDGAGEARVDLNFQLNPGSGAGDMLVYIPDSLFTAASSATFKYVYLYSKFETPYDTSDGFEEWSNIETAPRLVPLPSAAWAGMGLMGVIGAARIIRQRREAE